jgi:hypothetical protein
LCNHDEKGMTSIRSNVGDGVTMSASHQLKRAEARLPVPGST